MIMIGFGKQFSAIMVKIKRDPLCVSSDSETTSRSSFTPVGAWGSDTEEV